MSRPTTYRTGDAAFNGKIMHVISLGRLTAAAAAVKYGWVAPCDGTIKQFDVLTTTAVTHATAAISLGTEASVTANLGSVDIHSVTAGLVDYTSSLASATVTKGTGYVLVFTSGDTTGVITVGLVIEPN